MDDREIVSAVRVALADRVGQARFDLWFGPSTRLWLREDALTVEVPNRFVQDWLRANFRKQIEASCEEALGRPISLEFRVDEALAKCRAPAIATCESDDGSRRRGAPADLPAGQGHRKFATLEGFVVGASNRTAFSWAETVIERPGTDSPLLLHGPTGVGKTHLLEGVCSAARKLPRPIQAIYLSAEQFTTSFLEALHGAGLPSFRRKHRSLELLIIDDLQFFAGKRATLVELLHTIDTLLRHGRQLVLAADRPPEALTELGAEITARLSAGMVCRIDPPDHQTRLGIIAQLAAKREIELSDEVQQYIAMNLTSHARELSGALNRLRATSSAQGKPISKSMAEEALAEMIRHSGRVVRLLDIEKAVCDVFGLEPQSLQSNRKAKAVSHPRMLAMWLARKHTRAALTEIGHFFGRRSHSTVISANKKISHWMSQHTGLDVAGRHLNIEEAIRRVEATLKTG